MSVYILYCEYRIRIISTKITVEQLEIGGKIWGKIGGIISGKISGKIDGRIGGKIGGKINGKIGGKIGGTKNIFDFDQSRICVFVYLHVRHW